MPIDDLCGQDSCSICLANLKTGASAGAEETYLDSGNDLTYLGTKTVSSPTWKFTKNDVGSTLQIVSGTGWTPGKYTIESVGNGAAVLNDDPAAGSPPPASWVLNPAVAANCLMQQLSAREALQYSARGMNITHRAFFASDVSLTNRHRITWSGDYLRVHGYYKRGRPGEDLLWVAELELITTRMESSTN